MDYDMMGLEMYGSDGSDGMGMWMTADQLKSSLMGAAVGGGGIMLVSTVMGKIPQPLTGMFSLAEEGGAKNWSRLKSALAVAAGVLGGRAIHGDGTDSYRRDSAMAFVGGVAGLGLASLVASWIPAYEDGTPMVTTSLAGGHLAGADLAMLEAAVATTAAAWQPSSDSAMNGLRGPSVRTSMLQAPVTSEIDLGALGAYMPYLA